MNRPWEEEHRYLKSNTESCLDLVWNYGQCLSCEQMLFHDQNSGVFQLEDSSLRNLERMDCLLLVNVIVVLICSLQGYALSVGGLRREVDPL